MLCKLFLGCILRAIGSLFLNNIDQLSVPAQKALAQFMVSGSSGSRLQLAQLGQLRLICGTSADLKQQVSKGTFREDLYFELSVAELGMPPLRDRQEDIPQVASWVCDQLNGQFQTERRLTAEAMNCLQNYLWPGNVKELEVLLKRLFIATTEQQISARMVEQELDKLSSLAEQSSQEPLASSDSLSDAVEFHVTRYFKALRGAEPDAGLHERILAEVERPLIVSTLYHTGGNQIKAAAILGLNRNTLRKKIRELKISTNRAEYK